MKQSAMLGRQMLYVRYTYVQEASSVLQRVTLRRELPMKYDNALQLQETAFDFFAFSFFSFGYTADWKPPSTHRGDKTSLTYSLGTDPQFIIRLPPFATC